MHSTIRFCRTCRIFFLTHEQHNCPVNDTEIIYEAFSLADEIENISFNESAEGSSGPVSTDGEYKNIAEEFVPSQDCRVPTPKDKCELSSLPRKDDPLLGGKTCLSQTSQESLIGGSGDELVEENYQNLENTLENNADMPVDISPHSGESLIMHSQHAHPLDALPFESLRSSDSSDLGEKSEFATEENIRIPKDENLESSAVRGQEEDASIVDSIDDGAGPSMLKINGSSDENEPGKPSSKKELVCNVCEKTLSNKSDLRQHRFAHSVQKQHKCESCECASTIKRSSLLHTRSHTGVKTYKCSKCGDRSFSKTSFFKDVDANSGKRPFVCKKCGRGSGNPRRRRYTQ